MQVQQAYQLALLLLVVPSILINRVGGVVALSWVLGEIAHLSLPVFVHDTPMHMLAYEDAANMFSYIIAFGAGAALAGEWTNHIACHARWAAVLLFLPLIAAATISAMIEISDASAAYQLSTMFYWPWAAILFLQILLVLIGNDWGYAWRAIIGKKVINQ